VLHGGVLQLGLSKNTGNTSRLCRPLACTCKCTQDQDDEREGAAAACPQDQEGQQADLVHRGEAVLSCAVVGVVVGSRGFSSKQQQVVVAEPIRMSLANIQQHCTSSCDSPPPSPKHFNTNQILEELELESVLEEARNTLEELTGSRTVAVEK